MPCRQLGQAILMYADDNREALPTIDWGGNATVTVNWDSPYFVDYRNERAP